MAVPSYTKSYISYTFRQRLLSSRVFTISTNLKTITLAQASWNEAVTEQCGLFVSVSLRVKLCYKNVVVTLRLGVPIRYLTDKLSKNVLQTCF